MEKHPKSFVEMTDEELLAILMASELPAHEKAKTVITVREGKIAAKQNLVVIILTVVVAAATLVQAAGVAISLATPPHSPADYCPCLRHLSKRSDMEQPPSKPVRVPVPSTKPLR